MGDDAPLVKAVDMAKKYGDFIALHPLNVEVHSGEFFGVFGPNGAGKSTFIKLLTGQLKPSKGQIEVLGINATKSPQKVKANIGIVPESESPPSYLTPVEFLQFVAKLRDLDDSDNEVEYWLDWFGLEEKRNTMCKDLSKGQRQKVMLASAFIHKPKLLFLDEPTNHLDLRATIDILKLIRELPITAVAVIHELALLADFADRVIVLQNGKIVADGPPRQSLSKKIVWDVFGVNLVDISHPTSGKQFQVFDVLEQNSNL